MKKLVLPVFILLAFSATSQKKENIFITAELYKTKGLSLVYNRMIPKTNIGVGAGLEFIDISTKKLGGIMPGLDARYYVNFGKSTLMPLAQVGYNFYEYRYKISSSANEYKMEGGPSFSLGLGYSYKANAKGSGPYTALKYRSLQYKYNDPALGGNKTTNQLKVSIGWRF